MYLQDPYVTECFVTHITAICTLPGMRNLLSSHGPLLPNSSITSNLLKKEKGKKRIILQLSKQVANE
jgi:hypothetical protein